MKVRNLITKSVIEHHLEAVSKGEIDGLMSDFTDTSTLITPSITVEGLAQIKRFYAAILGEMKTKKYELLKMEVKSEVAYLTWQGHGNNLSVPMATDTFVVKGGKILCQTFTPYSLPKAKKIEAANFFV